MPRPVRRASIRALTLLAGAALAAPLSAQVDARLLRYPDVSATQIAFVYGGDIWVVPKAGGVAQRLSSPRGEETFPRFSPDGSRIAFSANYDGNDDVYVIPAGGGEPARVTHHPAPDRMVDWYPDGGSLLIASSMTSEKDRFNKLFRVSPAGGLPKQLPMPYGEFGTLSPDGKQIAYTTGAIDFRTWKRYRGGLAQDIWVFDIEKKTAKKVAESEANDIQPMWAPNGGTLYFVSDRGPGRRNNIWAYDMKGGQPRQITRFTDDDVYFPGIGPSEIVFQHGGQLNLLDLKTEQSRPVPIQVVSDLASLRPRAVKVARLIQDAGISPTGKRAVFEARGELFTVPEKNGVIRNLTTSSASAERSPAWSPDGKLIAYWSDRTGEYELTVEPADAAGEPRTVTKFAKGFRYRPYWSPDSKRVAFIDQEGYVHVTDVATGRTTGVDQTRYSNHGSLAGWTPSWSADGRWLAYPKVLDNRSPVVMLYDTQAGKATQATSGFYAAQNPTFDPGGKYLYFLTQRDFAPTYSNMDNTWIYANSTVLAAVPLRKDVPSPLAPRNDEEKGPPQTPAQAEARLDAKRDSVRRDSARVVPAVRTLEIDLDDFERRAVILPIRAGNYGELQAVQGKVLYHKHSRTGDPQGVKQAIAYYDLEERDEKTVLEDAGTFVVTADGKRMLVSTVAAGAQQFAILDIKPAQKIEKPLATADLETTVDPRAEWKQIFADAWRVERDYFYDPNMHGVDWPAMRKHYGALVEQANSREDVNWILGELIGELNSSHTYRSGGDLEQPERRGVGLLGVDFTLENGAYRIARIIDGAIWDSEMRSPLARSGVNVKEGDYLLAVNGRKLDPAQDPWAAFGGLAGQALELTVNSRPAMEGARTVLVETMRDENRLRNLAWIDAKRRRVLEASKGRIGYIYVPNTGVDGQTELARQFYGQASMDGLIIDERFNSGGQIPDRFVELLNRPVTNFWAVRSGQDWQWPQVANAGPKVMLINEWSGSGGDAFPYYFKQAGLGPLVGTRTWDGLIGISGAPPLVDGGSVTVPTFSIYSTSGEWIVENEGVKPDILVVDDPGLMAQGRDPQLERAIEEAMRLVEKNPPKRPKRPPYPNRTTPISADEGTRSTKQGGH
ncbi:MAG: PDZ domain-containing protein [Gemmatimonadaceae bacterium]